MTGQTLPGPRLASRIGVLRRRPLLAAGAGVCSLALLAAGVALSARTDVANLPVRLSALRAVTVTSSDGTVRAVSDGDTLRHGDRVRTGPDGSAVLTVDQRRVVLAGGAEVVVPDGASLDLRRGSVLLDRRRGPVLAVSAGDVAFELERGAVRLDRSFVVQVSVYRGRARLRTTTGRQLTLTALRTVGVAGRTLPTEGRPLALAAPAHPWERLVLSDVVRADEALTRLAKDRIDATLGRVARARSLLSTFADVLADLPSLSPASEAVLPVAIGAAGRGGRAERDRVAQAHSLRADGGSWGVVAALGEARSGDVASRLEALLSGAGVGAEQGEVDPGDGGPGDGGESPTSGPGAGSQLPSGGSSSGPAPSRGPSRPPTSSPSPTPSPSSAPDPVQEIVDEIEELVPTPSLLPPIDLPGVSLDVPVLDVPLL